MVPALAEINSHVETDAELNRDYRKLFPVTFDFVSDLGFHILPEYLSLPASPGLRVLAFKWFISSKGFY